MKYSLYFITPCATIYCPLLIALPLTLSSVSSSLCHLALLPKSQESPFPPPFLSLTEKLIILSTFEGYIHEVGFYALEINWWSHQTQNQYRCYLCRGTKCFVVVFKHLKNHTLWCN